MVLMESTDPSLAWAAVEGCHHDAWLGLAWLTPRSLPPTPLHPTAPHPLPPPLLLTAPVQTKAHREFASLNHRCMELRKVCNHPMLSYPPPSWAVGDAIVRQCCSTRR